jgi:hypothetical protein
VANSCTLPGPNKQEEFEVNALEYRGVLELCEETPKQKLNVYSMWTSSYNSNLGPIQFMDQATVDVRTLQLDNFAIRGLAVFDCLQLDLHFMIFYELRSLILSAALSLSRVHSSEVKFSSAWASIVRRNSKNILSQLTSKVYRIQPDLSLRDFFFFGYLKEKLQEVFLRNREDLISEIRRLLDEIGKETLLAISLMSRKAPLSHSTQGEYFHKSAKDIQISCVANEQRAPTS